MLCRLLNFLGFLFSLSIERRKQADECKQRTLNILNDALMKKDALLVDDPAEFNNQEKLSAFPLISTNLVKELISQLQKVTFRRGRSLGRNAYVHSTNEGGIVYLCSQFWKQREYLQLNSRPGTLIYGISRLLGYKKTIKKDAEKVRRSGQKHKQCPISAQDIQRAFSYYMVHKESYTNGSYSCCGETSRDTVCEKSLMSSQLRFLYHSKASPLSGEQCKLANEAKERTLNILKDALKKKENLLVDDLEVFGNENRLRSYPLISTDLVKELISQLQKVTFKWNKDPDEEKHTIAYVHTSSKTGTIYLCKRFWELPEFLTITSRPKTLIHEACHLLGYGHTIEGNKEKVKTSRQYHLCPVSVECIEIAFSCNMNHSQSYTNGCYSCCGETSRDTLCEKSSMTSVISLMSIMKRCPG